MPKILVVLDPAEKQHHALNRIKELPAEVVEVKVSYFYQPKAVSASSANKHSNDLEESRTTLVGWLEQLVQPYKDLGYKIETEIVIFKKLYEEIIQHAVKWQADYVFKPLRQHSTLEKVLYTSTDWNLTRFCPCPILFVSANETVTNRPILAAVNTASEDAAHMELNDIVCNEAKLLADVVDGNVHLVNAYNLISTPATSAAADPMAYQVVRSGREQLFKEAYQFAQERSIGQDSVHMIEGAANHAISECAEDITAGIVVLGTVARSGMSGLFIGNTAESVMEQAKCDIFVIKPPGFKSPIK